MSAKFCAVRSTNDVMTNDCFHCGACDGDAESLGTAESHVRERQPFLVSAKVECLRTFLRNAGKSENEFTINASSVHLHPALKWSVYAQAHAYEATQI